jgi:hypothetical protein
MTRLLLVAEMTGRDLWRRRAVLGLLAVMPLAFYLARRDSTGLAVRFLSLGLAWAISTAALFSGNAAKAVERRLRLGGYRASELYLGRLSAVAAIGTVLALAYFALVVADQDLTRNGTILLSLLLTVAVAAPLGTLISAVTPRDLEGTLVLMTTIGLQFLIDPAQSHARLLPFWSNRELATYAVDMTDDGYLRRGVTHAVCYALALAVATAAVTLIRLRQRRHVQVVVAPGSR